MLLSTLHIAGGVALLLYAVRYLRKGLDRLFGQSLGAWMQRLGRTPLRAFLAGLVVAIVAPSSTTVSLLAVSAVSAGHMTTRQMLLVMLGANLGLTVTVQVLALEIQDYAAIVILVGVGLFQFTSRALTGVPVPGDRHHPGDGGAVRPGGQR
jgi:phosphate:Na+ symporter